MIRFCFCDLTIVWPNGTVFMKKSTWIEKFNSFKCCWILENNQPYNEFLFYLLKMWIKRLQSLQCNHLLDILCTKSGKTKSFSESFTFSFITFPFPGKVKIFFWTILFCNCNESLLAMTWNLNCIFLAVCPGS